MVWDKRAFTQVFKDAQQPTVSTTTTDNNLKTTIIVEDPLKGLLAIKQKIEDDVIFSHNGLKNELAAIGSDKDTVAITFETRKGTEDERHSDVFMLVDLKTKGRLLHHEEYQIRRYQGQRLINKGVVQGITLNRSFADNNNKKCVLDLAEEHFSSKS